MEQQVQMGNKKGQSNIEVALLSFILIVLIKGSLVLFWIFTNFLWVEHQLYQGLICRAEKKATAVCKMKVLTNIKKLNKSGDFININLTGFDNKWKGSIKWKFYKWAFSIKSHLDLKNL